MDERHVADYFIVAGLPEHPLPLDEFSNESQLKPTGKLDPITDIAVIIVGLGEECPPGYSLLGLTPSGYPADMNHGSLRSPETFLCYRRGRDKPPLTDVGVLYEGKERVMSGCEIIHMTPWGRPANVNNSNSRIYITYRRADETAAANTLAVTDICIILANKGETPPHAFCQIEKTLNKGMVGSDVYLCYKKSVAKANAIAYQPGILARYPYTNNEDSPLPEQVAMFCLPMGSMIESWPAKAHHPKPVFSTFVLTGIEGEKMYGSAVTFYEELPRHKLTNLQKSNLGLKADEEESENSHTVHVNKAISILSHWPFFDAFRKFLSYLYTISLSGGGLLPVERYVAHFIHEVPYPSLQRPRILVQLNHDAFTLSQPEDSPLPQSGASYISLLRNLGPDNCMNVLLFALLEHKLLIHSLRPAVLTGVAEAVANMIFPFHWQCPYIPLCPLGLSDVLSAPCPFIVGVDSRYFDLYEQPPDVTCVDLDTNTISQADDKKAVYSKLFPKRPMKVLRNTLSELFEKLIDSSTNHEEHMGFGLAPIDHDFKIKRKQQLMEISIQEAFLRFMASILKGYKNYLLPITRAPTAWATDANSLFDIGSFLRSRDRAYSKFFMQFVRTQTFIRFIEERSFVSNKDASLAFFDECAEKVDENTDEPRLIEVEDSLRSERTVFISPPEPTGLPSGATYSYQTFPEKLDPILFPEGCNMPAKVKIKLGSSPHMARRSKQEIKTAQKMARQQANSPMLWAKCLLSYCYSLWFVHLPAYARSTQTKNKTLSLAYDVLKRMQQQKLQSPDEVCYRVLMQLCGQYHQPALAVKIFLEMKKSGIQPNAITYGFYNKAVFESKWPSKNSNASLMWTKLRNVIRGIAQFRRTLHRRSQSMLSINSINSDYDGQSRASLDSFDDRGSHTGVPPPTSTDIVNDLVKINSPNKEDRTSSAGDVSDKGYGSMSHEDSQKVAASITSLDSVGVKHDKQQGTLERVRRRMRSEPGHNKHRQAERPDEFRTRLGSIVKRSVNSMGSGNSIDTLKSTSLESPAGLLITSSQTSLSESGFGEPCELSNSQHLVSQAKRKRHRSAGDHQHPPRSTLAPWKELQTNRKTDMPITFLDNNVHDLKDSEIDLDSSVFGNDAQFLSDFKRSGESQQSNSDFAADLLIAGNTWDKPELVDIVDNGVEKSDSVSTGDLLGDFSNSTNNSQENQTDLLGLDIPNSMDEIGSLSSNKPIVNQNSKNKMKPGPLQTNNMNLDLFLADIEEQKTPTPADLRKRSPSSLSPLSMRTLVTENDPLGLFSNSVTSQTQVNPISSSVTVNSNTDLLFGADNLFGSPVSSGGLSPPFKNSSTSSSIPIQNASRPKDLLMDLSPLDLGCGSSNQSSASGAQNQAATPDGSSTSSSPLRRTQSMRLGGTKEYLKSWFKRGASPAKSISQEAEEPPLASPVSPATPTSPVQEWKPITSSPQPTPTTHRRTGSNSSQSETSSIASGTTSTSKQASGYTTHFLKRSESFGHKLKSAAFSMASRITEIKQSMQAPPSPTAPRSVDRHHSLEDDREGVSSSLPHRLTTSASYNVPHSHSSYSLTDGAKCSTPNSTPYEMAASGNSKLSPNGTQTRRGSVGSLSYFDQFVPLKDMKELEMFRQTCSLINYAQELFDVIMEVDMYTCTRCSKCNCMLFDEEVMAGWSADDSNLNTSCQFCSNKVVPFLHIYIKDLELEAATSSDDMSSTSPEVTNIQSHCSTPELQSLAERPQHVERQHSSVSVSSNASLSEMLMFGDDQTDSSENVSSVGSPGSTSSSTRWQHHGRSGLLSGDAAFSPTYGAKGPIMSGQQRVPERRRCTSECETSTTERTKFVIGSPCEMLDEHPLPSLMSASVPQDVPPRHRHRSRKPSGSSEPIKVPYLSPLVLRKELENILTQEGDQCLLQSEFVDEHPIIFWNLVLYFKRFEVPSHLPGFILTAKSTNRKPLPEGVQPRVADPQRVLIRACWDNLKNYEEIGQPMYTLWNTSPTSPTVNALVTETHTFSKSIMHQIVTSIQCNDVYSPIRIVMNERRRFRVPRKSRKFRSLYRELLYLSFAACSRENIDHDSFDREYKLAFRRLNPRQIARLQQNDRPPNAAVIWCRKVFGDLEL